jgi:hypothetical protein
VADRVTPEIARSPSRSGWRVLLFLVGCIALLVPVWIVRYPPLGDYPIHLAGSSVLAHLHDPGFRFSEWYRADWALTPYVATNALLVALQRFLPAELAGRILLSVCVVALPASVWFFARQVQPKYDLTVLWAFVLCYSVFFLFGFLQYCLSIAGCFVFLGLWWRYLTRPSALRWVGLLVAGIGLFSVHLFGFAMACAVTTVYSLVRRRPLTLLGLSWLAFVPGFALLAISATGVHASHHLVFSGPVRKLGWLLVWLAVQRRPAHPANLVVFALFAVSLVIAVWKNPDLRWNRDWAVVAGGLFGLYLLLPDAYEQHPSDPSQYATSLSPVDSRVLPFLLIVLFVSVDWGRRGRWLAAVAVLLFFVRMVSVTHYFLAEQPRLARLAGSFAAVPAGARILPMEGRESTSALSWLYEPYNFWAYGVVQRNWLSPDLIIGLQTLRLRGDVYRPGSQAALQNEGLIDWERVRGAYDAVWAFRVPPLSSKLKTIGQLVFAGEGLEVFAIPPNSTGRAGAVLGRRTRRWRDVRVDERWTVWLATPPAPPGEPAAGQSLAARARAR